MRLEDKGPIATAPQFTGALRAVARAVAAWPGVISAAHWDLYESTRVDGADYYLGDLEIGHLHLYGEAHIATDSALRDRLLLASLAQRFRYAADNSHTGWVQCDIRSMADASAAIKCFRSNYLRVRKLREATAKYRDVHGSLD